MTYVIVGSCVADSSCADICPVAAIAPVPDDPEFERVEQLFIDPAVCIDCGACLDACPVLAIYPDGALPSQWGHYAEVNRGYFTRVPR